MRRSVIFFKMQNKLALRMPSRLTGSSNSRDRSKRCSFHDDYGHTIDDCMALRDELEYWERRGDLNEFLDQRDRVSRRHTSSNHETHASNRQVEEESRQLPNLPQLMEISG